MSSDRAIRKRESISIREYEPGDSIPAITSLVNRAYAELAEAGFRYVATWQGDAITRRRVEAGVTFLAFDDSDLVGTISLYEKHRGPCAYYKREGVFYFGMFGIAPDRQGRGIGARLLGRVEREAAARGARELALDTAEGAERLLAFYESRGYRIVDRVDWPATNYVSVIMSKPLDL
ncbi:MAG: GNAT family N-acetyltransferase [Gemmatimonadetes bacterium]|nr:GNAT family N-acetyltransferase [Gemmatimonadota bacterium]